MSLTSFIPNIWTEELVQSNFSQVKACQVALSNDKLDEWWRSFFEGELAYYRIALQALGYDAVLRDGEYVLEVRQNGHDQ